MAAAPATVVNGGHLAVGAALPASSSSSPAAAAGIDLVNLALLQLCFDESEFNGTEQPVPPSSTERDAAVGDGDDAGAGATERAPFVPHAFVANKLEHVTIDVLEKDLATYARHLEAAVLKSVQEEVHEAFVEVSGQLVSAESTIRRVQAPLEDIESRLERCRSTLNTEREAAVQQLDVATRSELDRVFYSTLLEAMLLHNSLLKGLDAAKQHHSGAGGSPKSPSSLVATNGHLNGASSPDAAGSSSSGNGTAATAALYSPRELEFLCVTAVRFHTLVSRIKSASNGSAEHVAAVEEMAGFRKNVDLSLRELINAHFLAAYAAFSRQPSAEAGRALSDATGLYRQLQDEAAFADLFRDRIVRPAVEEVVSWRAAGSVKNSVAEAEKVFANLIAALQRTVLVALPLVQDKLGPSVVLMASAVWPAIGDTLMKRLTQLFSIGLPDAFHKTFTVAASLVAALEAACATPEELLRLRSSPDMSLWRSKWNLDVYHQIRRTELNARLEKSLDGPFVAKAGSAPFSIPQFNDLVDAITWLLDPTTVFIYVAQHQFLRDVCEVTAIFTLAVAKFATTAEPLAVLEILKNFSVLSQAVSTSIAAKLGAALLDEGSGVQAVVQFITRTIQQRADTIRRALVEGLVHKCMESLNHVSGLKRIFSTNTQFPVQPSAFLIDALNPLAQFQEATLSRKALSAQECNAVVVEVLDEATEKFIAAVQLVLSIAKKQQESLDNLAKGKPKAGPESTRDKPREKIVFQLYLDVQEYGKLLRPFGVNMEVYPPFQKLLGLVKARAEWLFSDCKGPEPLDAEDKR